MACACISLPVHVLDVLRSWCLRSLFAKPVALSIGCWTGLAAKSSYSCSFLIHVVQIANHRYHPSLLRLPWQIASGFICDWDDSCFWKKRKSCVFPYGTRWCILAQNTWLPRMCIGCTNKIVRYLSFTLVQSNIYTGGPLRNQKSPWR